MLAWAAAEDMFGRPASNGSYNFRNDWAVEEACNHGRILVVQWLLKHGCRWTGDLSRCAKQGNLPFLQWVHANAAFLSSRMDPAAKKGLFWDPAMPSNNYMAGAAAGGHLHILEWAVETLKPQGPHLLQIAFSAAENGQLEVLKWAHSRGKFESAELCSKAAIGGHLECLQWAHENGYPLKGEDMVRYAGAKSLAVLQWLLEQGCKWDG